MKCGQLKERLKYLPDSLEIMMRLNDEVYKIDNVQMSQVLDDLGRITPAHSPEHYQPGVRWLVSLISVY
jgi:hypothetical protein